MDFAGSRCGRNVRTSTLFEKRMTDPGMGSTGLLTSMESSSVAPSPTLSILRSEGLVKRYKKRIVVNSVTIQVRQGEIVGLLGPNGAGKTTTFYMIVGMVRPNGG